MKRILIWITGGIGILALLIVCVLISGGGLQLFKQAKLPEVEFPLSLSSDLAYFKKLVLANEKGATKEQYQRFSEIVDAAAEPKTVDELSLILWQSLAAFDNAHTTVFTPLMYRLPVRFHWTSDALIIVKARPEHSHLLGQRVLTIGGRSPNEMLDRVPELIGGGTDSWVRYRSEYFYSTTAALTLFDANVSERSVDLETVNTNGIESTVTLTADPHVMPGNVTSDLFDSFPGDTHSNTEGWITFLQPDQELPLYLDKPKRTLFLKELPDSNAVYLRVNRSRNDKNETVRAFTDRALQLIDESESQYIIVDFRHHPGGDFTLTIPLVKELSRALPSNGQLYLITGATTFSAAIVAGSQFKRYIPEQLTIVGQEIGDTLRFRSELFLEKLPHSKVGIIMSTAWNDVANGCRWFDNDCFILNKLLVRGIGSFDPDIEIENSWSSYLQATDLVLEAVITDINKQNAK